MQESLWWWQCRVRYSLPLPPPAGISVPASTSAETLNSFNQPDSSVITNNTSVADSGACVAIGEKTGSQPVDVNSEKAGCTVITSKPKQTFFITKTAWQSWQLSWAWKQNWGCITTTIAVCFSAALSAGNARQTSVQRWGLQRIVGVFWPGTITNAKRSGK